MSCNIFVSNSITWSVYVKAGCTSRTGLPIHSSRSVSQSASSAPRCHVARSLLFSPISSISSSLPDSVRGFYSCRVRLCEDGGQFEHESAHIIRRAACTSIKRQRFPKDASARRNTGALWSWKEEGPYAAKTNSQRLQEQEQEEGARATAAVSCFVLLKHACPVFARRSLWEGCLCRWGTSLQRNRYVNSMIQNMD